MFAERGRAMVVIPKMKLWNYWHRPEDIQCEGS